MKAKTKEPNIKQDTLYNNEYNENLSISHSKNCRRNKNIGLQYQITKWVIFMYCGKETKETTILFKETNKGCIQNKKHNTEHSRTPPTNR
jgi:hypothetical protein